jgi:hypothetical protein
MLARVYNQGGWGAPTSWDVGDNTGISANRGSKDNNITDGQYFFGMIDYDAMTVECFLAGDKAWKGSTNMDASFAERKNASAWDYADLVKMYFVGTIKAGTKIEIYGEMIE